MGYTHYWRGWVTFSESFIEDVQTIITHSGVSICDWDGENSKPVVDDSEIRLNGDDSEDEGSHESFHLYPGVNHRTFCKTARKPYDVVVATILLRANNLNNSFKVESDGNWDEQEWINARDLYFAVFKEVAIRPEGIRLPAVTEDVVASN